MTTQPQMFWIYENGRFVRVEWRFVDQAVQESSEATPKKEEGLPRAA